MKRNNNIPEEILHYTERSRYKEWKREQKIACFENVIFALLLIVIIALSFYSGRLVERHFAIGNGVKTHFE